MEQKQHYYRKQIDKNNKSQQIKKRKDINLQQFYKEICTKMKIKVNLDLLENIDSDQDKLLIQLRELKINEIPTICKLIKHGGLKQVILRGSQLVPKSEGSAHIKYKLQMQIQQQILTQIFQDLKDNTSLQTVIIRSIVITNQQINKLKDILITNSSLQQLGLINSRLSSHQLQILSEGLRANTGLTSLDLSKNALGDLQSCATLVQLIAGEEIGEEEESSMKKNFTKYLERSSQVNHIQDESYNQVSPIYNGIIHFNLSSNQFSDHFIHLITPGLAQDKCIKSINLRHNLITSKGYLNIIHLMATNYTLISLDLRNNQTDDSQGTLKQILDALMRNVRINREQSQHINEQHKSIEDRDENLRLQELVEKFCEDKVNTILDTRQQIDRNAGQNQTMRALYESINQQPSHPIKDKMERDTSQHITNDDKCDNCYIMKRQLLQAEAKYFKIKLENRKIKNFVQQNNLNYNNSQSQMINSLSMINPINIIEPEKQNMTHITEHSHSQHHTSNHNNPHTSTHNADDLLNKIEYFMLELTRMMDNLESLSSKTNNFSCSMTNSNSQNNNLTQKLINSEKQVNLQHLLHPSLSQVNHHNTVINNNTSHNTQNNTFNLNVLPIHKSNNPDKKVSFNQQDMIVNQTFNQRISIINSANTSKDISSLIGNLLSEKKHNNTHDTIKNN